ncbi:MAG: hypothetical protein LBS65_05505 [Desulfovibrio sp.]|jgi:hypothetical protein|nr:hypothetical protein [Desulfovibrio sp.]
MAAEKLSREPGRYIKRYLTEKPRDVRVAGAYVNIKWDDGFSDEIVQAIQDAWTPIMEKMKEKAKQMVHVGGAGHGDPNIDPRDPRPAYKTKRVNHGYKGERDLSFNTATSRNPGTLKASIKAYTAKKQDRTAVLGYLKAGNLAFADYALVEEMGAPGARGGGRPNHAFLRPAFNEFAGEAIDAVKKVIADAP